MPLAGVSLHLLFCETVQSRKLGEPPPNFISILMHFYYILINEEKRNSHQEVLFLVIATRMESSPEPACPCVGKIMF